MSGDIGGALDRTQPGLPMKRGRLGTMTHDDKRNGTTTLFAALSVLDGKVIGRNMQRHRHQEFIRFLNAVEREVPKAKAIHVMLVQMPDGNSPLLSSAISRFQAWVAPFFGGLPRRLGAGGGVMAACERVCSGMRLAWARRR